MKKLFYAKRIDRSGNTLLTSYASAAHANKYGGGEITEGVFRADQVSPSRLLISEEVSEGCPVIRSMIRGAPENSPKPFVIIAKSSGVWGSTPFATRTYGDANTIMKALHATGDYEAVVVLDMSEETAAAQPLEWSNEI